MDVISILTDTKKGRPLEEAHIDLLQGAYELQSQNIAVLKENNAALKESNALLKQQNQQLSEKIKELEAKVSELESA